MRMYFVKNVHQAKQSHVKEIDQKQSLNEIHDQIIRVLPQHNHYSIAEMQTSSG